MAQPEIHFAALFGIDYDSDLVSHWIEYYREFEYDSYTVWLHTFQNINEVTRWRIQQRFLDAGFGVSWASGQFNNGELRARVMRHHASLLPTQDYLVTADSDEFHEVKCAPKEFKALIRQYDAVEGYLVDCWGETLVDAKPGVALKDQYPHEGVFREAAAIQCADATINRRKIIACKNTFEVNFIGSHMIQRGGVAHVPSRLRVLHYTYRSSILDRMGGKDYFHAKDLWDVMQYFRMDDHPALHRKLEYEDRLQEEKGWMPVSSKKLREALAK